MKLFTKITLFLSIVALCTAFKADSKKTIYSFSAEDIAGNKVNLSKYEGKVLLIVNVASKCGLTPQYADLQELYDKYADQGLEVLAFPANDFMGQEPGTNEEINSFCTEKFGITFTMFGKVTVTGKNMHPMYNFLTKKAENGLMDGPVKWNFQKFVINREGQLVDVIKPVDRVKEADIEKRITKYLNKP